ncbi:MAG: RnfABCDGE type electron transport complex subunit C, partial [Deltaproteobacteria bacterium]|nr:RnfABCDGE type electron transport complex subunit C [Deltaproteobacteria bacterium]
LGGAGFSAHIKLAIPPEKNVDTIIINAAECEPYITVDYRQCIEGADDVIDGLLVVRDNLGLKNAYIAIEDNKPDAISLIRKRLDESGHTDVRVVSLPSRYPQGAEKVLIHSVTGRSVQPGKLPADAGCLVMNVGSAAFLSRYLKTGKPLVSRSMTIDGTAIREPKNVRVPIGIELSKVVEFCGGYSQDPERLLVGGPMMGRAMPNDSFVVVKNNNALLAFAPGTLPTVREDACIRCGRCVANCPMHLMPTVIEKYMRLKDKDGLQNSGAMICMECGCCAFMCPARRPLVQYMRESKALLRKLSTKK